MGCVFNHIMFWCVTVVHLLKHNIGLLLHFHIRYYSSYIIFDYIVIFLRLEYREAQVQCDA